jgi:hypothetical protein
MATAAVVIAQPTHQRHPGGRPSTYRPEYCQQLLDYFQQRLDAISATPPEPLPPDERGGKGSLRAGAQRIYAEFPTLAGFASQIGTSEQRLWEWANRNEEFRESRARVVAMTKHLLVNGMLDGRYNAQAAQFVAKNLTDMRDKIEIDQTVNAGEDSVNGGKLREALSAATPEQLAQFGKLIEAMQSNKTAIAESTT